jgi:5-methylcytosine-specific restriction protein B
MVKNINEFLQEYDVEKLKQLKILNKQGGPADRRDRLVLNRGSVDRLIELMKRKGIERLEYPNFYGDVWYLDIKGNFNNPRSKDIKRGNISQLKKVGKLGKVFDKTNPVFNPYFKEMDTTVKLPGKNITQNQPVIEKESNDMMLLQKKKSIILYGPPGTGKTYSTRELAVKILGGDLEDSDNEYEKYRKEGRIEFITFHPSYSYEEFIEGITVKTEGEDVATNSIKYTLKPGIFKQICKRALGKAIDSSDEKIEGKSWIEVFKEYETLKDDIEFNDASSHVLIIDEINRGDIAKIFGELITLLEADKRLGQENELIVKLPASNNDFCVPPNLYIIATMNTADRSIALLDVALRRRFGFIEMNPDFDVLAAYVKNNSDNFENGVLNMLDKSQKAILKINTKICSDKAIGRDKQIGHSFLFKVNTIDDLILVWRHEILPLLEEYCYGDYSKINQMLFGKETGWISQIHGIQEINRTNLNQMLDEIVRNEYS